MTSNEEMRKKYPVQAFKEYFWEIYDEVEGKIIAHFYYEKEALEYIEFLNKAEPAPAQEDSKEK